MKYLTQESKIFWQEKEKEYGAPVRFFTFATFLGKTGGKSVSLGGLIYLIDKKLHFEDFEKDNWFSKIMSKNVKYEKTQFLIDLETIENIQLVTKSSFLNCISGIIDSNKTNIFKGIFKIFFQPVTQIKLKDGSSYFFETMSQKELLGILKFVNTI